MNPVVITPPFANALEIALGLEVGEDALHGALGDPDELGDVTNACRRVGRDTDQDVGVVGEKGPTAEGSFTHQPSCLDEVHLISNAGNE